MAKVTVIIPTYNAIQYIDKAIKSVLTQSFENYEIIVVDDGSTDNTQESLDKYVQNRSIRYFYQHNGGPSSARNKGIAKSISDYIAFLDSDDEWTPFYLEKSIMFLEENNYDWVCSAYIRKERNSGKEEIKRLDSASLDNNGRDVNMLKNGLFYFSSVPIITNTILAKKSLFDTVGYFDETFHSGEDWDMWLRFEEAGFKGGYLDEPLAYYMIRDDGITKSNVGSQRDYHLELAEKHAKILGINNKLIRRSLGEIYFKYADLYFHERRDLIKAAGFVAKGLYYNPDFSKLFKGFRVLLR